MSINLTQLIYYQADLFVPIAEKPSINHYLLKR
jgi:hypothetical protein